MQTTQMTVTVLTASPGHWLTQAGEIPDEQRIYTQTVYVGRADTPDTWRETTDAERSEHLNRHNTENKNNKDYEIIA